uniref:DNA sulfur modification protein DndC n=1 Tax=Candidatus Kentrum sp. FW TaxID=2126338 RepID=A0A450SNU5_9GAMM|nr:MAG: DNA sulfur modification protein DndC [Candidatus Kentron sp. FW]VFJ76117.1 MAG: DNA sulfur modification protein DndC [Candidatus Kentron sp. FW]
MDWRCDPGKAGARDRTHYRVGTQGSPLGAGHSTLVIHPVIEHILSLPRSERHRPVHVIANDTLVESPLVINHIRQSLVEISSTAAVFNHPALSGADIPD